MTTTDAPFFICLRVSDAAAAIRFCERAFGSTEVFRVTDARKCIVHAQIDLDGHRVSLTDEFPQWGARAPTQGERLPVAIHLRVADAGAAVTRTVDAGAQVMRRLEDQPYGERRAILTDPFGYEWVIRETIEALSPEEMERRLKSDA